VRTSGLAALGVLGAVLTGARAEGPPLIRTAADGAWSSPAIWEGGRVPAAGARVQVRPGHRVVYDVASDAVLRSLHIGGTLTFARDRDTCLTAGLIKIQAGEDASENGFDCDHAPPPATAGPVPALEIGRPDAPLPANHTALIRLAPVEGLDPRSCPALVNCGGRLDLHGAPMSRTWVKLAEPASGGATAVTTQEPVTGWRSGHRVIVVATERQRREAGTLKSSVSENTQTEERRVVRVEGSRVVLDEPLRFAHRAEGEFRGEIANLSRNVVVASAEPLKARGHTMYHRGSQGGISYAEFRHLGKRGVLGRYPIHFHQVGSTMRGAAVVGAAIWDSHNRWLTIHGTNYLVVRDCVGYGSVGHGFFLEDGTEVNNLLERNLAVHAYGGRPLPEQIVRGDGNQGAGFWWANSHNAFLGNVAAECDEYGFRYDAPKGGGFDPRLPILQPDGSTRETDIRTLPFIRFAGNESHTARRHAFNLGGGLTIEGGGEPGGVNGIGPDNASPLVIRDFLVWDAHWGFHPEASGVLVDGLTIADTDYALWRANFTRHAYRRVRLERIARNREYYGRGIMPRESEFPGVLRPRDSRPPVTVITGVRATAAGAEIRGTVVDDGEVRRVVVNGRPAQVTGVDWEALLPGAAGEIRAHAEDAAGNVEQTPHVLRLTTGPP
jgi:hypothetical protein